jgi:hypothetical protein
VNLPRPPNAYDPNHTGRVQSQIEKADKQNIKTGHVFDKILMKDTATGVTVTLTVASGSLVIT